MTKQNLSCCRLFYQIQHVHLFKRVLIFMDGKKLYVGQYLILYQSYIYWPFRKLVLH